MDFYKVGVVAATRAEAESDGFMCRFNIGMIISFTDWGTTPCEYDSSRGEVIEATVPVSD